MAAQPAKTVKKMKELKKKELEVFLDLQSWICDFRLGVCFIFRFIGLGFCLY
ncbi:unnamed protein product [Brassica rapa]|uniref:Uncharacterized protein n=2 Tax=Brassica TaxID=3705 RepID=A0A8D9HW98_BRACM|nr:unnamed protein product [Brassica napus]CAG7906122.1 unnamed protein product [Brassica rapa]